MENISELRIGKKRLIWNYVKKASVSAIVLRGWSWSFLFFNGAIQW